MAQALEQHFARGGGETGEGGGGEGREGDGGSPSCEAVGEGKEEAPSGPRRPFIGTITSQAHTQQFMAHDKRMGLATSGSFQDRVTLNELPFLSTDSSHTLSCAEATRLIAFETIGLITPIGETSLTFQFSTWNEIETTSQSTHISA